MAKVHTIAEHIYWAYANLGAAHSALNMGRTEYGRLNYMIRAKLFKGLKTGTMNIATLFDDEKVKLEHPRACTYCGSTTRLSVDHLIPKISGGADSSDNLVWACRSCNSSKGSRDLLVWLSSKGRKPPLLLLRRYLKLVHIYCTENNLLDIPLANADTLELPFAIDALPYDLKPLSDYCLWITPT